MKCDSVGKESANTALTYLSNKRFYSLAHAMNLKYCSMANFSELREITYWWKKSLQTECLVHAWWLKVALCLKYSGVPSPHIRVSSNEWLHPLNTWMVLSGGSTIIWRGERGWKNREGKRSERMFLRRTENLFSSTNESLTPLLNTKWSCKWRFRD